MDRQHEKNSCRGENCVQYTLNGDTTIKFMWKNLLGLERLYDDPRDICPLGKSTRVCFEHLFAHARRKDILIIGSVPIDLARFRAAKMTSLGSFKEMLHAVHFSNISLIQHD